MMPFPWFVSLLLGTAILWGAICSLSAFHLSTAAPGCSFSSSTQQSGWLKK